MMKSPNGYILQDLESLTQQDPPIPRAVPAMWTNPSEMTLAKCLENREGITNVYIRGFLPETTDETLYAYASRFGKIDRCKAIVDLDTGLCKGFGFVQYFNFESCENCIRGFFYLGYQASFAQKSRNSRLKDLEDKTSTNIYCTNIPNDWTEADLRRHFEPYRVVSEKISRDEKTGVSKEVGFARFETRDVAEQVLTEFHNAVGKDGVKLLLRFADTKAQKLLKQQSNERRAYRAGEYNYSVEVVQGSTPSPSLHRLQQTASHLSPGSQVSYPSPVGMASTWTPATSISPSYPMVKSQHSNAHLNTWSAGNSPATLEHTPAYRGRFPINRMGWTDTSSSRTVSSRTALPSSPCAESRSGPCTPRKENVKAESLSPISSRREIVLKSPRSIH
ncbi:RNA binding motif, single stranded interacting protein 3 [Aspergillus hancockii]|nr:RNA binding motif, single stranded interacting protein 3 [Aspergillus hancockii]